MVKNRRINRPVLLLALLGLVLLTLLGIFLIRMHTKRVAIIIPSKPVTSAARQKTTTAANSTTASPPATTDTTSSQVKTPSTAPPAQAGQLIAPYGSFVSNHSPGKNNTLTDEESICNTTAGATCYIQFTNNGSTKKLDSKIADSFGSVTWDWDVKNAGFAAGSWQITAVATLNGQTKSTADPNGPLEVN
jgi:hypothetical protein